MQKTFQAEPSPNNTSILPLSQMYICKKILGQSTADDVHYCQAAVPFPERAMLSEQAEAAAEGSSQLPEEQHSFRYTI